MWPGNLQMISQPVASPGLSKDAFERDYRAKMEEETQNRLNARDTKIDAAFSKTLAQVTVELLDSILTDIAAEREVSLAAFRSKTYSLDLTSRDFVV